MAKQKLTKATRITKVNADFGRGHVEGDEGDEFHTLYIRASIGGNDESYDYSNWHLNDLKALRDAITAFLKEVAPTHD